jgi:hypothetical protein|tara:strand:- start:99 stop:422 length:324 start_codon:yes stop_codon:yes gene_type:complete
MEISEFYQQLSSLPRTTYSFDVAENQKIVATGRRGKAKGITFNPVTAVAHRQGHGSYGTNKRDTLRAGRALGLSSTFSENLYQATTNHSNRGHSQVVRGKIRSALEL